MQLQPEQLAVLQRCQPKTDPRHMASLMALHFYIHYIYCNWPHATVVVENNVLQLSDTLNFEETKTIENRILNFLQHLSYGLPLTHISTVKILCIKLYCIAWTKEICYTALHMSVTLIKLNCVSLNVRWFNVTVHVTTVLVVCHAAALSSGAP
jgi:hypothetical protein